MAVQTAAGDGASSAWAISTRHPCHLTAVPSRLMALLAQERRTRPQQIRRGGAVRVVANRAVFGHRLMRTHKRAALLHVAGIASVVHAVAHHQRRPRRTVRVVAVGAGDLAFLDRMARGAADLRALFLVAGETHFRLRGPVAHLVVPGMHLMARGAGGVTACVNAALPMDALATLMTGEARLILDLGGNIGLFTEHAVGPWSFFNTRRLVDVGFAGAVATSTGRRSPICHGAVLGLADGQYREFPVCVMTARTLGIAFEYQVLGCRGIVRLCRIRRLRRNRRRKQ